jgi:hypothetical protein
MASGVRTLPFLALLLVSSAACRRVERTSDPQATAPSASASAIARVQRIELDDARFKQLQAMLPYHQMLRTPAFSIPVPGRSQSQSSERDLATLVFGRVPEKPTGAFTTPALAVLRKSDASGGRRAFGDPTRTFAVPEMIELLPYEAGNLLSVDAFDVLTAESSTPNDGYHSAPSATGPGYEILVISTFEGKDPSRRFQRAFHILWTPDRHVTKSLASYAIRDSDALATIDALRRKLDELRREPACPDLAPEMDRPTIALCLQCMLEHDRREQIAKSTAYPIDVLVGSGVVRSIDSPGQLLELWDDVIHRGVREGVRRIAADPDSVYRWEAYDGFRLGYAGLVVDPSFGTIDGKRRPPRIVTVFNDDPSVHEKMSGRLSTDNRVLWKRAAGEVVCRTSVATHVLLPGPRGRHILATWKDKSPVFRSQAPSRVLFGLVARAGQAGNTFYEFIGPQGRAVTFEHITLYGPEPAYEYQVRSEDGDEPCLNHEHYKGY